MKTIAIMTIWFLAYSGIVAAQAPAQRPAQAQGNPAAPQYTMSDNPLEPMLREKDPERQIQLMDNFVRKYPKSPLLVYIYPLYYMAYLKLNDYPKAMEYSDKLLVQNEKLDVGIRYGALRAWAEAYNSMNSSDASLAAEARDKASDGIRTISEIKKPERLDDSMFEAHKRDAIIYFHATAGAAALVMKGYIAAAESFKNVRDLAAAALTATPPK